MCRDLETNPFLLRSSQLEFWITLPEVSKETSKHHKNQRFITLVFRVRVASSWFRGLFWELILGSRNTSFFHFTSFHFISFIPNCDPPLNSGLFIPDMIHVYWNFVQFFAEWGLEKQQKITILGWYKLSTFGWFSYIFTYILFTFGGLLHDYGPMLIFRGVSWICFCFSPGNQKTTLLANSQIALLPQTVHLSQGCHHGILLVLPMIQG